MAKYELKENQYLPNGLGKPAETYYYLVNENGQTINKKTLKPYRGIQMLMYAFKSKICATAFMKMLNNEL